MSEQREMKDQFINAAVEDHGLARKLLDEDPNLLKARYPLGETALHYLAIEGYIDAVRFLLSLGAEPDLTNEFGDTPLIDVAVLGLYEVADVLLVAGADPNETSDVNDNVLHCAVRSGNARLVRRLLEAGAKGGRETDIFESPFDVLPLDTGKAEAIVKVLEEFGYLRPEDG